MVCLQHVEEISDYAISFDIVNFNNIYFLEFVIYHLEAYGYVPSNASSASMGPLELNATTTSLSNEERYAYYLGEKRQNTIEANHKGHASEDRM